MRQPLTIVVLALLLALAKFESCQWRRTAEHRQSWIDSYNEMRSSEHAAAMEVAAAYCAAIGTTCDAGLDYISRPVGSDGGFDCSCKPRWVNIYVTGAKDAGPDCFRSDNAFWCPDVSSALKAVPKKEK